MGEFAERIIVKEIQEKSSIKQEEIVLRNKISQGNKQEANVLALEWFWKFIAYTYFICRTLGLLILIDLFIFGRPNTILFVSIFLYCCYLNLKFYKYISGKKTKGNI